MSVTTTTRCPRCIQADKDARPLPGAHMRPLHTFRMVPGRTDDYNDALHRVNNLVEQAGQEAVRQVDAEMAAEEMTAAEMQMAANMAAAAESSTATDQSSPATAASE